MTSARMMCLARAAWTHREGTKGTALLFEHQFGKTRQVNWLLKQRPRVVRIDGGRLVATRLGHKLLAHQLGR